MFLKDVSGCSLKRLSRDDENRLYLCINRCTNDDEFYLEDEKKEVKDVLVF